MAGNCTDGLSQGSHWRLDAAHDRMKWAWQGKGRAFSERDGFCSELWKHGCFRVWGRGLAAALDEGVVCRAATSWQAWHGTWHEGMAGDGGHGLCRANSVEDHGIAGEGGVDVGETRGPRNRLVREPLHDRPGETWDIKCLWMALAGKGTDTHRAGRIDGTFVEDFGLWVVREGGRGEGRDFFCLERASYVTQKQQQ